MEGRTSFLGGCLGLPLSVLQDKRDTISAVLITDPKQNGLALAGDEDVRFFVDGDAILGEDGDGAVISGFADAHQGMRKVCKGVCSSGAMGQRREWKASSICTTTGAAIGNTNALGGGAKNRETVHNMVSLANVVAIGTRIIGDHG